MPPAFRKMGFTCEIVLANSSAFAEEIKCRRVLDRFVRPAWNDQRLDLAYRRTLQHAASAGQRL
jgi:hypothetical protein